MANNSEWKDEKKRTRTIANELGVSRSSVQDLIHKYEETGTVHDRPRSGRKRKAFRSKQRR